MKIADLLAGVFFVAFGLAFAGYGWSLPPMPGQRYGAGLFPIMLGLCFVGCGAQLAWTGWRERRVNEPLITLAAWTRDPFLRTNVAFALGLVLVYVLFSDFVGFIPLATVILVVMFAKLGVKFWHSLLIAVAAVLLIYIGFARILRVPLPRGLLEGWIW